MTSGPLADFDTAFRVSAILFGHFGSHRTIHRSSGTLLMHQLRQLTAAEKQQLSTVLILARVPVYMPLRPDGRG